MKPPVGAAISPGQTMAVDELDLASGLHSTNLFRSHLLVAEDRAALGVLAGTPRSCKAGSPLVSEGNPPREVYFLVQGWACRYKRTQDDGWQITGLVPPGEMCNLNSLLLPRVNFGVRALTAATVVGLPRERLRALAAERPSVALAFTWFAIVENAILSEWALSLGRQSARDRLARLLSELVLRLVGRDERRAEFELPFAQTQIADMLGLTSIHVNRMMRQLREERLIAVDGRRITVPDVAMLARSCGFDGSYLP